MRKQQQASITSFARSVSKARRQRKAIADMLERNELIALRDEDIEDCTVIATANGRSKTINVVEAGNVATRFPLEVATYIKGHPDRAAAKTAMLKLLKDRIISRSERVA